MPARTTPAPAPEPEPAPTGPDLPVRVIGKNLKLDPSIGIGYRGWQPQQYHSLSVRTENALTWQLELKAQLFSRRSSASAGSCLRKTTY